MNRDGQREREGSTHFVAMVEAGVITDRFRRNLVRCAVGIRVVLVCWAVALCAVGPAGTHPASISFSDLVAAGVFGVVIGMIVTHGGNLEFVRLGDRSVLCTAVLVSPKWTAITRHADRWALLWVPELQAVAVIAVAELLGTSSSAFTAGMVYVASVLIFFWIVGAVRAHVAAS